MKLRFDTTTLLCCIALAAATLLVYVQVASHEFVNYDDYIYITQNPNIQHGLTGQSISWALTSGYALNWHPLTWVSHMIDVDLFGLKPAGHHLVSVLIHMLNAVLLFLLFRRMAGALWQSAFVAGLFALHPLNVESVAWAAERKDVLSALFGILTMLAYVRYAAHPGWKRYLLVALCLSLGLMAKPMLVTVPLALLLLDYWPLRRYQQGDPAARGASRSRGPGTLRRYVPVFFRLLREKIPLFMIAAASSVITIIVQQRGAAVSTLEGLPPGVRISNALVSYVIYLRKTFWPADLGVFYPHPLNTLPQPEIMGAAVLLICLTAFVVWSGRRREYLAVGWLWFLVMLIPMIGLVQVGQQAYADRYMYLPLVGIAIVAAWGAGDLLPASRGSRIVLASGAAAVLAALGWCTWVQAGYWRDSAALFAHTVNVTADNYLAQNNLGAALYLQGKYDEAAFHYSEAVRIKPDYEQAYQNLISALLAAGKSDKAAEAALTRGTMFGQQGNSAEATAHFQEALRLKPAYPEAHNNLGIVLAMQGNNAGAESHFSEALRIDPGFGDAHANLALVLEKEGKIDEAVAHFSEAVRLNPANATARASLERLAGSRKQSQPR
jgi:tetratricopeptide (TPR) repeat protein